LQLTDVSFARLQASPQAPQLLVVVRGVQTALAPEPQVVSRHVHVPPEQSGVGWAQGVPLTHAPPVPQVCGTPATLQPICPGAHSPVQMPETQVLLVQTIPFTQLPPLHVSTLLFMPHVTSVGAHEPSHTPAMQVWWPQSMTVVPHCPLEPQVTTPLPEHVVVPGLHVPVHCPIPVGPEQMEGHALGVPQVPFAVHCATPLPTQVVCPGAHSPVHDVPTHVWFVHGVVGSHAPASLQSAWAPVPTHSVVLGVHATHVLFRHTEFVPVQVVCVTQLPVPSHVWMELPRQRVWLGAQKPWHEPPMHVWEEQGLPLVGVPLALQLQGVLLVQPTWLGAQVPVHDPLRHVWALHGCGEPQTPPSPHDSTPLLWHCTWFGAQSPSHAPPTHVLLPHETGVPHVGAPASESHDSTPLPEHCVVPGLHEPVHWATPASALEHTPVHAVAVPQVPVVVHAETPLPWHSV
jgi:hypothetical protein